MKRKLALAAALALTGGMAHSQITTDTVIADYSAQGFGRIEIRDGLTQIKVEAIRGTEKVEAVYDKATGTLLKREVETAGLFESDDDGIRIRDTDRDFLRVSTRGGADPGRGRGASDDDGDDDGDADEDRGDDDSDPDEDRGDDGDDDEDRDDDHGGRSGHDDDGDDDDGDDYSDDDGGRGNGDDDRGGSSDD